MKGQPAGLVFCAPDRIDFIRGQKFFIDRQDVVLNPVDQREADLLREVLRVVGQVQGVVDQIRSDGQNVKGIFRPVGLPLIPLVVLPGSQ